MAGAAMKGLTTDLAWLRSNAKSTTLTAGHSPLAKRTIASTLVVLARLFARCGRAHHHYFRKPRLLTAKASENLVGPPSSDDFFGANLWTTVSAISGYRIKYNERRRLAIESSGAAGDFSTHQEA